LSKYCLKIIIFIHIKIKGIRYLILRTIFVRINNYNNVIVKKFVSP